MYEKRLQNIFLAIVAVLLVLNLGVILSPSAHAIPKTQYKVVVVHANFMENPGAVQQALDQQSAAGWEYVNEANGVMIFKK